MNINGKGLAALLTLLAFSAAPACAAGARNGVFSVGARRHTQHSIITGGEWPYDEGDVSFGVAYEYHEQTAYWQLALGYAPDVNGTNMVERVITPQLNLIAKDQMWRGGVGVLCNYVSYEEGESDWLDVYWQFLLGLNLPIARASLDVHLFYVFRDWDEIEQFDFSDIELGLWLALRF